jgi:hypothetical protein
LRNLFDQYFQPENRVTHALLTALHEDRKLLDLFLRELVKVKPPVATSKLSVLEQQFPGEAEPGDERELDRRGIPDGWIFDSEGWCVFIETKVLAVLRAAQIESHRRTAVRRGFHNITAVAIIPRRSMPMPAGTIHLEWRMVYAWLRRHAGVSVWAARAAEFLEIAEAKLIETEQFVEGSLTTFFGFSFGRDRPFTYLEGKRVLGLALDELRGRKELRTGLGMNPKILGRPAITGRQSDAVWNFLSLSGASDAQSFTKYPHLTLGITVDTGRGDGDGAQLGQLAHAAQREATRRSGFSFASQRSSRGLQAASSQAQGRDAVVPRHSARLSFAARNAFHRCSD